jgi:hypothetical protein
LEEPTEAFEATPAFSALRGTRLRNLEVAIPENLRIGRKGVVEEKGLFGKG